MLQQHKIVAPHLDELHQELQGDAKHLIIMPEAKMTDMLQRAVYDGVISRPLSDSIFTYFEIAEQEGVLLRVLPAALFALLEVPLAKRLASVNCGIKPCIPVCGAKRRRS